LGILLVRDNDSYWAEGAGGAEACVKDSLVGTPTVAPELFCP